MIWCDNTCSDWYCTHETQPNTAMTIPMLNTLHTCWHSACTVHGKRPNRTWPLYTLPYDTFPFRKRSTLGFWEIFLPKLLWQKPYYMAFGSVYDHIIVHVTEVNVIEWFFSIRHVFQLGCNNYSKPVKHWMYGAVRSLYFLSSIRATLRCTLRSRAVMLLGKFPCYVSFHSITKYTTHLSSISCTSWNAHTMLSGMSIAQYISAWATYFMAWVSV